MASDSSSPLSDAGLAIETDPLTADQQLPLSAADRFAISAFVVSGFLALVYEICWMRQSTLILGSTTYAVSTVLAVFMAGLALGNEIFGRISRRNDNPIRLYALLEIGAGLLVLSTLVLLPLVDSFYSSYYDRLVDNASLLALLRLSLISACLLPPTIMMGGTLPLLCRQYVRQKNGILSSISSLYALNTLGAALGCIVCGFLLIPLVGITTTVVLGAAINILIGVLLLRLKFESPLPFQEIEEEEWDDEDDEQLDEADDEDELEDDEEWEDEEWESFSVSTVMGWLFFFMGFVALGHEVVWTRFLSLVLYNNVYTYTLTLSMILFGIVIGSMIVRRGSDVSERHVFQFGLVQVVSAIIVFLVMMLPFPIWQRWINPQALTAQIWVVSLLMLVPAILSGISFPLGIRLVLEDPSHAGSTVGRMAAINTLGGIAGSLAVGFLLLPYIGLERTLRATTGIGILVGICSWLLLQGTVEQQVRKRGLWIVLFSTIWLAISLSSSSMIVPRTRLPGDFLAGNQNILSLEEGVGSYMAVLQNGSSLDLEVNRMWQGTNKKNHQTTAAHVPMLFHKDPRQVLVVGLGTGQTARSFLAHNVEQLDCVEIEQRLLPILVQHYEAAEWMDVPNVRLVFDDGRNYITHASKKYDVISLEVGQVFRPGVAAFYTREFYQRTLQRLNPDGVVCQFVPMNFLGVSEFKSVVRTFVEVFPQSILWYNTSELLLIGTNGEKIQIATDRLEALQSEAIQNELDFAYWGGGRQYLQKQHVFLGGFLSGPQSLQNLTSGAEIYIDDRPLLEYIQVQDLEYHRPLLELIENNLDSVSTVVEQKLSPAVIASSHRVREDNLTSILVDQYLERGNQLFDSGDVRGGIAVLSYAASLLPKHARANSQLADRFAQLEQLEKAVGFYVKAVNVDNDMVSAHRSLGFLFLRTNRVANSIIHFEEALRIEPQDLQSAMYLADILSTHPSDTVRNGSRAMELVAVMMQQGGEGNWQVLVTAAAALAAGDQFDQAIQACQRALNVAGEDVEVQSNIRLRMNRYQNKQLFLVDPARPAPAAPGGPAGGLPGPMPGAGPGPAGPGPVTAPAEPLSP